MDIWDDKEGGFSEANNVAYVQRENKDNMG